MKVDVLADVQLQEILDFTSLKELFKNFTDLTQIDVSLHDIMGEEVLAYRLHSHNCTCEIIKHKDYHKQCRLNMAYAGEKAAELGEPYIFKCGCMIKCSVPIMFKEKIIGSLSCGPVLLWEADDLARLEVKKFINECGADDDLIDSIMSTVKQLSCENMTSAAQMLRIVVDHMCSEESRFLDQRLKINIQQKKIAELLHEKKQIAVSLKAMEKRTKFQKYPLDMEKELIAYVQVGDIRNARRMLNDLLGEIFCYSSGNLDIIKAKLYELSAILTRAGVDSGAPLLDLAIGLKEYNKILTQEANFEDICFATNEAMEMIITIIYENRSKKQTNQNLVKAINYIKQNYNQEISLETVSKNVYVSNYYLSHLFREELDMTFSDYLNKTRIEQSINLMKENGLNIQEIAAEVGFNDANYFTKTFKKYYGVTPKNYMNVYVTLKQNE